MPSPMSVRDHRRRPFWHLRRGADLVSSEIDEELSVHIELRTEELTRHAGCRPTRRGAKRSGSSAICRAHATTAGNRTWQRTR